MTGRRTGLSGDHSWASHQFTEEVLEWNSVGWNPSRELEDMSERLNRIFAHAPRGQRTENEGMTLAEWTPSVDIMKQMGSI